MKAMTGMGGADMTALAQNMPRGGSTAKRPKARIKQRKRRSR